jgi:hypothetical protein
MPVIIFFRVPGQTDVLVEGYERTTAPEHPSRLAHICARTADGMAVTEVWSSRDDLDEFMRTTLPPIMEAAGMPGRMTGPPTWEICEVHNLAIPDARASQAAEAPTPS